MKRFLPTTLISTLRIVKEHNSRFFRITDTSAHRTDAGIKDLTERKWWRMTGSNRRPPACKAGALPAELIPRRLNREVGGSGWARTNDPRLIKTVL